MSNGEMILSIFPNTEVKFYKNLSDMRTVSVKIKDDFYGGIYSEHVFSREWWESEYKKGE